MVILPQQYVLKIFPRGAAELAVVEGARYRLLGGAVLCSVIACGLRPQPLDEAQALQELVRLVVRFHRVDDGLEFMGIAGFWWRCTDVGTRTIVAVQLDRDDPHWYRGPPYIAKEVVFDEHEIAACHLTEKEAIRAAIHEHETSGHPGFPHEVVTHMMDAHWKNPEARYPHKGVLRFDRCRPDGEILHPYAGRQDGEEWTVLLYLPFLRTYAEMPERDFIALPIATAADVRACADRQSTD